MNKITLYRDFSISGVKAERMLKEAVLGIALKYGLKTEFTTVLIPGESPEENEVKINEYRISANKISNASGTDEIEDLLLNILSEPYFSKVLSSSIEEGKNLERGLIHN
ncbi:MULTISPECIES: hypothetical protein [Fervidicoccus]|uniref:Uncharacterized protein n=2 Tax=Fervidicoccus fontis TaxID=683846 RepID=H9ZZH0_FERFK|nr:hypothetical protein [Fervidicoccus fontis]AFH42127.1 hypothetical protein FFONT_0135 [Fervidicoccus fontis Kam940]PMB78036.1 MAG: hypothetical protein C0177_01600 [Fervidicoccus fontis]HEW64459.1 hypothetical protein [Fervidicoccus fontis]